MTRIMGVDASTKTVGMVVLDQTVEHLTGWWAGSSHPQVDHVTDAARRIYLAEVVRDFAKQHQVDLVAIEDSFMRINPQVGKLLDAVIVTIENACFAAGLSTMRVTTIETRRALGLKRGEKKDAAVAAARRLFPALQIEDDHQADAAGVAKAAAEMIREKGE